MTKRVWLFSGLHGPIEKLVIFLKFILSRLPFSFKVSFGVQRKLHVMFGFVKKEKGQRGQKGALGEI